MKNIFVFSCLLVLLSGMQTVQGMKFWELSDKNRELCSALYESGLDDAFIGKLIQVHEPAKGSYSLEIEKMDPGVTGSVVRQAQLIQVDLNGLNEIIAVSFDKEKNLLDIYKQTVLKNIDMNKINQQIEKANENPYTLDIKPLLRRSTDINSVPESEEEKKPIATFLLVKEIQAPKEAWSSLSYIKMTAVGFAFLILIGAIVRCTNFFK